jgi:hypothetical protein
VQDCPNGALGQPKGLHSAFDDCEHPNGLQPACAGALISSDGISAAPTTMTAESMAVPFRVLLLVVLLALDRLLSLGAGMLGAGANFLTL